MRLKELYWLAWITHQQLTLAECKFLVNTGHSIEHLWAMSQEEKAIICAGNQRLQAHWELSCCLTPEINDLVVTLEKTDIQLVTIEDDTYPLLLREIYDPPPLLFVRGTLQPKHSQCFGIVGTRKSTYYGNMAAKKFAQELAEAEFTIVSGMADGIDTLAHEGALKVKGQTIAVLGTGIDQIYPSKNRGLYEQIRRVGAVISEFPPGYPGTTYSFPRRNRIISGICKGILVIEGPITSGAMITAKFAVEHNRDVFALPGRITEPNSQGPHQLIQDGAKLVTSVTDILNEYNMLVPEIKKSKESVTALLTEKETAIYNKLTYEPIHIDKLSQITATETKDINALLAFLEMKELIKSLPGKFYVKS